MNAAGKTITANHIQYMYLSYGTNKENLVSDQEIHTVKGDWNKTQRGLSM